MRQDDYILSQASGLLLKQILQLIVPAVKPTLEEVFQDLLLKELERRYDPLQLLDTKQACKLIGISRSTLLRLDLPCIKVAKGALRYRREDIEKFINSKRVIS